MIQLLETSVLAVDRLIFSQHRIQNHPCLVTKCFQFSSPLMLDWFTCHCTFATWAGPVDASRTAWSRCQRATVHPPDVVAFALNVIGTDAGPAATGLVLLIWYDSKAADTAHSISLTITHSLFLIQLVLPVLTINRQKYKEKQARCNK